MKGSCLCGGVHYEIDAPAKLMQYCHCSRCRKFTGSAHGANLFVKEDQFRWTQGEDLVGRFSLPDAKYFATSFCKQCGSSLPWQPQGTNNIAVPSGTLDDDPGIKPSQNIFWASRACWYEEVADLPKSDELPPRK